MLRVQNLTYRRGDTVLLQDLDFAVHAGQRVAVAGRNGAGKSTLFQLILGELQPEGGDLELPDEWRISHMQQEVEVSQRGALDYAIDGHRELRQVEARLQLETDPNRLAELHTRLDDLGGYQAEANAAAVLTGLGFKHEDLQKPYAEFSGGWRIRLHLAKALMSPSDLLLLDEPTNHLDLEAILWLENWLARFAGTVLLIAHDRTFLDACTNQTLYLSNRSGRLYQGNYSSCERQRAEQRMQQQSAAARRAAKAAHIQKFVDRFRAKASKAKQVQSRIKALEKLKDSPVLQLESPYAVAFRNPAKVSNPLMTLRDLALGYGATMVLQHISELILPGARIGVLGENGAGKSTLLKALVGELTARQGELLRGQHCAIGYFAQHQLESLSSADTGLQTMARHKPAWREQQVRDYLGHWGFNDQMISRAISTLSGGEKARLVLALLAADEPALLVLDEPTNHLDLDMRDALAMALQDFEGAVVIVSHDRSLLDQVIDEFWLVANGRVQAFNGDLHDYTSLRQKYLTAQAVPGPAAQGAGGNGNSRRQQRQQRAARRDAARTLQQQVRRLERQLEQSAAKLQDVETRLADTDTYQSLPAAELDELLARAGKYRRQVESLEEEWLLASERLEAELQQP